MCRVSKRTKPVSDFHIYMRKWELRPGSQTFTQIPHWNTTISSLNTLFYFISPPYLKDSAPNVLHEPIYFGLKEIHPLNHAIQKVWSAHCSKYTAFLTSKLFSIASFWIKNSLTPIKPLSYIIKTLHKPSFTSIQPLRSQYGLCKTQKTLGYSAGGEDAGGEKRRIKS